MTDSRRYYWLKLKEDFFRQKEVKMLRELAGGDVHTIIYLKILLLSLDNDGKLYYEGIAQDFAAEIALDIDEKPENVRLTVAFLMSKGILVQNNDAELEVMTAKELTGSEGESARRMRRMRQAKSIVSSNNKFLPSQCDTSVTQSDTEIDIDKEKREKSKRKKNIFTPPTVDEVKEYADSIGFKTLNAQYFFDYYAAADWKRADGTPLLSWKRAVVTWKNNDAKRSANNQYEEQPPDFINHREHKCIDGDERKSLYKQMGAKV